MQILFIEWTVKFFYFQVIFPLKESADQSRRSDGPIGPCLGWGPWEMITSINKLVIARYFIMFESSQENYESPSLILILALPRKVLPLSCAKPSLLIWGPRMKSAHFIWKLKIKIELPYCLVTMKIVWYVLISMELENLFYSLILILY